MAADAAAAEAYARHRDRVGRAGSAASRSGRDIGPLPPVADPLRKVRCQRSFKEFCETYFPQSFPLAWSADHLRMLDRIERAVLKGGLFAMAMPRGSGKTTMAEVGAIFAILTGARRYVALIGADQVAAAKLLESIKGQLVHNEMLAADYPEVVFPIKALGGIAQRSGGQLFDGRPTDVVWGKDRIVLPNIPGSAASGAILEPRGINAGIRGMKYGRPDGTSVRPDLVVIDDPQTDASARSSSQCASRVNTVCGAILGLAGPGKKIAGVMPCTVIAPGDMADQVLDRQKHPEWQGERTKLLYKFPDATTLWEEYTRVRDESLRAGNGGREATEFYRANREAMDAGAQPAWPARYNEDELSALQHAMNLLADLKKHAFFAEYQNDPQKDEAEGGNALTAEQVQAKADGTKRGVVPAEATRLVAMVDVQKELLFFGVLALTDDFTAHVVDYGTYPDQRRDHFTKANVRRTLMQVEKMERFEQSLAAGLASLLALLLGREWKRSDGGVAKVDRCHVDARWGESTDIVKRACRDSPHAAVLFPSFGTGIGASSLPITERKRTPGDRAGLHWFSPRPKPGQARHLVFDANFWKSFLQARLAQTAGGPGGMSLFGQPEDHLLLGEHLAAEYPVRTEGRGRTVTEWKVKPQRPDNDLLDCLVGCCVAGSAAGASLAELQAPPAARKKVKFKLSERMKAKGYG